MSRNPFRTKKGDAVQSITSRLNSAGKMVKTNSPLVNDKGEFNATSKKDLLNTIRSYGQAIKSEGITRSSHISAADAEEKIAMLQSAFSDPTGHTLQALGEDVSDVIRDHIQRDGLTRTILMERELARQEPARIRFKSNKATAMVMGAEGFKPYQQPYHEQWVNAPEYYVNAYVLVSDKDIARTNGDVLNERLEDANEKIQVAEDRRTHILLEAASQVSSQQIYFNSFTPQFFQSLRNMIQVNGINCRQCILAADLWNDICAHPDFTNWFDPVTQHEIVHTGMVGNILGVNIVTDSYLANDNLRVLHPGECFFTAEPEYLGQLMIRDRLRSQPIDQYPIGRNVRGWFLTSLEAAYIANVAGVAKGQKL